MSIFEHILVAWEPVGLQCDFMKDDNFTIIIIIINHNRLLHLHVIPRALLTLMASTVYQLNINVMGSFQLFIFCDNIDYDYDHNYNFPY